MVALKRRSLIPQKAFQEQDKSKTRPKRATVKKVIPEDPITESEEDLLNHIAGKDGVDDLAAMWSTPSTSTSKHVHPVSFSTPKLPILSLSFLPVILLILYHYIIQQILSPK